MSSLVRGSLSPILFTAVSEPVLVSGEAGDGEGVLLGVAAGAPGTLLTVQLLQLIVFQGSSSVILDPLPQQRDHGALHGALQRALGRLGLVDDGDGELGVV